MFISPLPHPDAATTAAAIAGCDAGNKAERERDGKCITHKTGSHYTHQASQQAHLPASHLPACPPKPYQSNLIDRLERVRLE